jgi:hypothetical protein
MLNARPGLSSPWWRWRVASSEGSKKEQERPRVSIDTPKYPAWCSVKCRRKVSISRGKARLPAREGILGLRAFNDPWPEWENATREPFTPCPLSVRAPWHPKSTGVALFMTHPSRLVAYRWRPTCSTLNATWRTAGSCSGKTSCPSETSSVRINDRIEPIRSGFCRTEGAIGSAETRPSPSPRSGAVLPSGDVSTALESRHARSCKEVSRRTECLSSVLIIDPDYGRLENECRGYQSRHYSVTRLGRALSGAGEQRGREGRNALINVRGTWLSARSRPYISARRRNPVTELHYKN